MLYTDIIMACKHYHDVAGISVRFYRICSSLLEIGWSKNLQIMPSPATMGTTYSRKTAQ
jgi:hypothetical protein